ncbi:MAG: DMT family transporter [Taibaiella sp.]|jgi:transporter family-2 protein
MRSRAIDWSLALFGGLLLALMLDYNSLMAKHTSPLYASWIAHGIGSVASIFLIVIFLNIFSTKKEHNEKQIRGPLWAYLGGIPGALTVVLAAITVNSSLGLSGTLAFMLVGQVIFGIVSDVFGLFGTLKRKFIFMDFLVILAILTGSGIIIFFGS